MSCAFPIISVPSRPPTNVGGNAKATEIILQWEHPPFDQWNGKIMEYHIKWKNVKWNARIVRDAAGIVRDAAGYQDKIGNTSCFKCVNESESCEARFSSLEPYHKYVFKIAAKTIPGLGPFSKDKDFHTLQAGKLFLDATDILGIQFCT